MLGKSLTGLQALRFFAASAVVCLHCFSGAIFFASGVDVFFVISGFVMVLSSDGLFAKPGGATIFAARRIKRIVPLYWLMTAIVALIYPVFSVGTVLKSLLFIPTETRGWYFPVLPVGWTLNFEMYFYCIFAVFLALPRKIAVTGMTCTIAAAIAIGVVFDFPPGIAKFYFANPIMLEFVLGAWLGVAYLNGLRFRPSVGIAFIIGGLLAIGLSGLNDLATSDNWCRLIFWGLPAIAIVAAIVLSPSINPVAGIVYLFSKAGDASYAIYLVHSPLVGFMAHRGINAWMIFFSSLIAGTAVHFLVEPRLTEAIDWLTLRWRGLPPALSRET